MYRMGTSLGSHPDYFKGQSHSIAYITRCIPAPIKPRPTWTQDVQLITEFLPVKFTFEEVHFTLMDTPR